MLNFKANTGVISGTVSGLQIEASSAPKNPQVPEYFGVIQIVKDNGKLDGEGVWQKDEQFYEIEVGNNIVNKFQGGINEGDEVAFATKYITKDGGKITKLRALSVISHMTNELLGMINETGREFLYRSVKINKFHIAGNVSNVDIKQSQFPNKETGMIEYYGTCSVALDASTPKQGGGWNDKTDFVEVKVNSNVIRRVKAGIAKGDKIALDGFFTVDSWEDKQTKQARSKLKFVATNVTGHVSKSEVQALKDSGALTGGQSAQQPAQQGGFKPQQPAQQGGFKPQQPAQQGGFKPQQPAQQGGFKPQQPAQHGGFNNATSFIK